MKTSPCTLDASKKELPDGKQSRMLYGMVTLGQYSMLYAPVARW